MSATDQAWADEVLLRGDVPAALKQLRPVKEVAAAIGVTDRALRNYCTATPALPHECRGGKGAYLVATALAYEYVLQHVRRRPTGLRAPAGWPDPARQPVPPPDAEKAPAALGGEDPYALFEKILREPDMIDRYGASKIQALGSVLRGMRAWENDRARAERRFSEEELAKALRAQAKTFVHEHAQWAPGFVDALLLLLRDQFDVDLRAKNIAARDLLLKQLLEDSNRMLVNFRKTVEDQVVGLRVLEGTQ